MKCACIRRPWTFICMREFFSCLSIASVDGKQHLSEVVFSALIGFSLRKMVERFGFWVVSIHPGLFTSDYGIHEVGITLCGVQHVLGVRPRNQVILSFSLQWKSDESPRHYPTQMLLAINWSLLVDGKYSHMHMRVQGCFIEIHQFFAKIMSYFSNRVVYSKIRERKVKTLIRNWRDHCRTGTRKHTETVSKYFDGHGRLSQSEESNTWQRWCH
jgi:hypothetical protein